MVTASAQTFAVPPDLYANLQEIGRYVEDDADGEIDTPRTAALRIFANDFIEQHREAFEEKGDGQVVYIGNDEEGGEDDALGDGGTGDTVEQEDEAEDAESSGTGTNMTFSLSDGPTDSQ